MNSCFYTRVDIDSYMSTPTVTVMRKQKLKNECNDIFMMERSFQKKTRILEIQIICNSGFKLFWIAIKRWEMIFLSKSTRRKKTKILHILEIASWCLRFRLKSHRNLVLLVVMLAPLTVFDSIFAGTNRGKCQSEMILAKNLNINRTNYKVRKSREFQIFWRKCFWLELKHFRVKFCTYYSNKICFRGSDTILMQFPTILRQNPMHKTWQSEDFQFLLSHHDTWLTPILKEAVARTQMSNGQEKETFFLPMIFSIFHIK